MRIAAISLLATVVSTLAPTVAFAQPPSPLYVLFPPNLHLIDGQTSASPLTVLDRSGNSVAGTVTFSGFDQTLLSISATGHVTALRAEGAAEIGTWVTAHINGARVGNATVVRVLANPRPEPFATVMRPHTVLYYPTIVAGDDLSAEVNRFEIPDVTEYAYLVQQQYMNLSPIGGSLQILEVDFGGSEQQRVCGISGNPIRLGWNVAGLPHQNCFMVPAGGFPRRPQWFVMHHELGHNFTLGSQTFATAMGGVTSYVEGVASAIAVSEIDALLQNPALYPMSQDAATSLGQELNQVAGFWTSSFQNWLGQGAPFAQLTADVVDGMFLSHRNQRPTDFATRFFKVLQPGYGPQLESLMATVVSDDDKHTIFAALVSAAAGQDLAATFVNTYHYPLKSTLFASALAAFSQILDSGSVQPPTGLRVTSVTGNQVSLAWAPPASGPIPTDYMVEGGLTPGQTLGQIAVGGSASVFTVAAPSGSFFVRVRAVVGATTSGASNEVLIGVNVVAAPSPPVGLTGLVNGDAVGLSWRNTFSGGPTTGQQLVVSGALTGTVLLPASETFTFNGVPPGTYSFSVRSKNAVGTSADSNAVILTFPAACSGAPLTPANFVASRIGTTVQLTWEPAATGPASLGYTIEVNGSLIGALATTARSFAAVAPAGTYSLHIVATNACGASAPTAAQTVVVP